jgi:uncharacterized protein YcfJ
MKKLTSILLSAGLALSFALPLASVGEAASKRYCRGYAKDYADRKATKRVVRDSIIAGATGAVIGKIIGGKDATLIGALGGGTTGAFIGSSKWKKYYNNAYRDCRYNM